MARGCTGGHRKESEGEMSPRKPTIDDQDDIDDEDGALEEEIEEETDLTLHEVGEDAVALGGTGDAEREATEEEEEPEEE
jgi:hypothetical protein